MSDRPRQVSTTEDVHLPDATVTITLAADRSRRPEPVPAGHDPQARGAWWETPEPAVAHRVRVGARDDRFGGWERQVPSADAGEAVVAVVRTALLAGWRPSEGDPPGL